MRLRGKVAIVTGGASGIGAATARLFAREGAFVICTDIAEPSDAGLGKETGATVFLEHDVTSRSDWLRIIAEAEARCGPVSILVNNAGIVGDSTAVQDCSEMAYRRVIEVNQVGTYLGMHLVCPSMLKAGGGAIVNMSSAAGLVGAPNTFAYVASKFAVAGMTKAAALDLGRFNIRVNSVHPGMIETPMTQSAPEPVRSGFEEVAKSMPLGRLGQAEEIAELCLFLASDAASFCTGGGYLADGGLTAT
ncbi:MULTISPECIES: SDR family NAD(P)-dependent oxidoreductase [Sphingobium]|uniref:SDR family NAD(P)-dependent oxidoreductase n=1 Tax=Sphingobium sp. MI1205 TaxID=407020 RepID=UPI0007706145|nr:glucose 1-dehydrogenase [Sphingobium sp. MI1205]AMK19586.1 2O-beta-hydroxysteroid dehydrogenase [Sphingobium sp. MI1205]